MFREETDLASLLLESTKFTTPKESVSALDFAKKNLGISQLKVKSQLGWGSCWAISQEERRGDGIMRGGGDGNPPEESHDQDQQVTLDVNFELMPSEPSG